MSAESDRPRPPVVRVIRNRHGSGLAAMQAWASFLWGEPQQLGPDKWHVYGAHRRRWQRVNVEFTAQRIVIVWPEGGTQ